MTYMTDEPEPWSAPPDWDEWVRQPRVAKALDVSSDFLATVPGIRRRKVSHRTVLLNRDDVVAWFNAGIRSRYIASDVADPPIAAPPPPAVARRYGAVVPVPAAQQVAS